LTKQQLDFAIKGQLIAFEISNEKLISNVLESESSSKKTHYKYSYNSSINLCVNTYLKMVGITKYYLETLQQDLQKNGLTERIHGNTGHVPQLLSKVLITDELKEDVKTFIINYAQIHGLQIKQLYIKKNWIGFGMILLHFFLHILKSFQD
jgi:hypothetical protein